MSCKSSLCLRCAKVYVDNWLSQVSKVLHERVIYRHIIPTVPATIFYHNAAVSSAWMISLVRSGARCSGVDISWCSTRMGSLASRGYDGQEQRWEHLHYLPCCVASGSGIY